MLLPACHRQGLCLPLARRLLELAPTQVSVTPERLASLEAGRVDLSTFQAFMHFVAEASRLPAPVREAALLGVLNLCRARFTADVAVLDRDIDGCRVDRDFLHAEVIRQIVVICPQVRPAAVAIADRADDVAQSLRSSHESNGSVAIAKKTERPPSLVGVEQSAATCCRQTPSEPL
jgi:hypothetical protein